MTSQAPQIGVVIPAYNTAWSIRETVASVLAQTYPMVRCVISDDGSTDQTLMVAEDLCRTNPQLTLIRHPNGGVAAARNRGASVLPDADYLLFLDADDILEPTALEVLLRELEKRPEAPAAHGYAAAINRESRLIGRNDFECVSPQRLCLRDGRIARTTSLDPTSFFTLAVNNSVVSSGAVLIRRNFFDRVGGYDLSYRCVEDWDLWLRLSTIADFVYVDSRVLRYRITGASMSANHYRQSIGIQRVRRRIMTDARYTRKQQRFARDAYRAFYLSLGTQRVGGALRDLWRGHIRGVIDPLKMGLADLALGILANPRLILKTMSGMKKANACQSFHSQKTASNSGSD